MRQPAQRTVRPQRLQTFPAPIGGWIRNQNLAVPNARKPDGSKLNGAFVIENWFPTATGLRMRRGSNTYLTVGDGTQDILSLFTYINGNNRKMFATTATGLFDVTTQIFPVVLVDDTGATLIDELNDSLIGYETPPPSTLVAGLTGGNWITVQFANANGDVYLRAVNGVDVPLVYDGSTWGTGPAITGTGLDPATLSYVWTYKNRIWFIRKDSLDAWYLPADSIGGAAVKFPLSGVFTRGGSLVMGASWSLETSGGGLSEQCIFMTSEGEIAVYQGSDPSVAASWSKVGIYRTGRPLGPKAHIRAGGDIVVATDIGFLPVSASLTRDFAALSPVAVSYPIEVAWNEYVANRSFKGWSCEVWPTQQMVAIALPTPVGGTPTMIVANARTGAWAPYTGWNALCVQAFNERLFFGSTGGRIVECEVTGMDEGVPYTSSCVPLFDPLKSPASLKTGLLARSTLMSSASISPQLSLQADYQIQLPPSPPGAQITDSNVWDGATWDQSAWDQASQKTTKQEWQSIGGSGYALAPAIQITSGSLAPLDVELVSLDLTYDVSDIVT